MIGPSSKVIEVKDLKVVFQNREKRGRNLFSHATLNSSFSAVHRVSFSVERADTLGLAGETGSGKTTVARVLVGLQKPTSGEVRLMGEPVDYTNHESVANLRRHVGLVMQDPFSSLNPRLTVSDILKEPLIAAHNIPRSEFNEHITKMVGLVGLRTSVLDSYPRSLSGGEKQRVSIARALVVPKQLLVLDEPTSSLDVSIQAQVLNTIKMLQKELKFSYLFISHDTKVLKFMCRRMCVLFYGRMVETGDTSLITSQPLHPYTMELMGSGADDKTSPNDRLIDRQPAALGCSYRNGCAHAFSQCVNDPPVIGLGDNHNVSCFLYSKEQQSSLKIQEQPNLACKTTAGG